MKTQKFTSLLPDFKKLDPKFQERLRNIFPKAIEALENQNKNKEEQERFLSDLARLSRGEKKNLRIQKQGLRNGIGKGLSEIRATEARQQRELERTKENEKRLAIQREQIERARQKRRDYYSSNSNYFW
jgi:hypothetical protein